MIATLTSTVLQFAIEGLVGLMLSLCILVLYVLSPASGGDDSATDARSDPYFEDNTELCHDFTNSDVQQWLRTDGGMDRLEDWIDADMAQSVHDGADESHYAVLNGWWYTMATELGFAHTADAAHSKRTIAVTFTAAYSNHSVRVGDVSEFGSVIGTSPFIVEYTRNRASETEFLEERTESQLL